jgi:Cu/Ag efflux protein CusF
MKLSSILNKTVTMKTSHTLTYTLLIAGVLAVPLGRAAAQSAEDEIAVARSVIKADRQTVVTKAMQLNETESQAFWPIYHEYRAEMDKVADGLLNLVKDYAKVYPEVPEDRAKQMLKDLTDLENKQLATRTKYLKKFNKALPASKTLRFAQVENRLDLAVRLELAAGIPLVPIEGRMTPERDRDVTYVAGVPGGVVVQTIQLSAKVAAIDKATREVTLVSSDGIKKTVKAGPDVVNFDQIHVGDRVKVTAAEELVVQMAQPGESADNKDAALVALAPKGAKPGGVVAATTQVTATVKEIDLPNRTATLEFEDGSTRTFPVRSDVDLKQRKVGEKVSFRATQMVALAVECP